MRGYLARTGVGTAIVGLFAIVGCNSEPPVYKTHGKVVYKGSGKPFNQGKVWFESTKPPYIRSMAKLNENGEFDLGTTTRDNGAIEGEHRVQIAPPELGTEAAYKAWLKNIDQKYLEYRNSGIKQTVLPNQENNLVIEITRPGEK
jgi:hypothetical protein